MLKSLGSINERKTMVDYEETTAGEKLAELLSIRDISWEDICPHIRESIIEDKKKLNIGSVISN